MDAVQDIKDRLAVEDVVAEYVELKPAGSNLKGLSPFTQEKTPSFIVSPEKQIWHCFSSGRGGDMFTFVEEVEGVDFKGALELLARKAGIDLEDYRTTSGKRVKGPDKARLRAAMTAASRFYQQQLVEHQSVKTYAVEQRGLNRQVITDFTIGYAPNSQNVLFQHLKGKGFSEEEQRQAGLLSGGSGNPRDMFRDRLLITLHDRSGQPIGFTGRILQNNPKAPKYINTAQTALYDKSRHVFGLHLARDTIREQDLSIVMEGNMDVVAAHQFDFKNTVATAGTAFTADQFKQLKGLSRNIALAFDSDAAGLNATLRAIPLAQKLEVVLSIINLPAGADPDDLIREDKSAWEQAVSERMYVIDWVIAHYKREFDLNTPRGQAEMSSACLEVISMVQDPVEQEQYLRQMGELLNVSVQALQRKLANNTQPSKPPRHRKSTQVKTQETIGRTSQVLDNLLALTLVYPKTRIVLQEIKHFVGIDERRIAVLQILAENNDTAQELLTGDLKDQSDFVKILQLIAEENYGDWPQDDAIQEADTLSLSLIELQKDYKQTKLSAAIAQAEAAGDPETVERLLNKWHEISKEE